MAEKNLLEKRMQCPFLFVKEYIFPFQTHVKTAAPHGYTPSLETQQELIAEFSKLRTHIAQLRMSKSIPRPPVPLVSV